MLALVRRTQCLPLTRSVQASSALHRCSHMPQQFLHRRPLPSDCASQAQQQPLQNSSSSSRGGAPPAACTLESNRTMQQNSANTSLEPTTRDNNTAGDSDQSFAAMREIGECANEDGLRLLLKQKKDPTCYVWWDPSPTMHITQGITLSTNVNKMVQAGCRVKVFMADWSASSSMDRPDICYYSQKKIQDICSYNVEMWRAAGMCLDGVEFVRLSDVVTRHADQYWALTMDISRNTKLSEMKSCLHSSKDTRWYGSLDPYALRELSSDEIIRTCLQSAAMLSQKVDVWLLDIGQRAGNMVARQYCGNMMSTAEQPIALFNNVLPSLLEHPETEMWGDPRWAIFMEDTETAVGRAIRKAFCPPGIAECNPCLEYIKHIFFPLFGKFDVVRKEENGGNKTFLNMAHLAADYETGALQPADVKPALEKAINMTLQPIRDHFASSAEAKKLLRAMQGY